jgi:SAM-dependent methyltransferase
VLAALYEDGEREELPVSVFFRSEEEMPSAETLALELCRGRVLEVGAGAGSHALALQERGIAVEAIDVAPECVEVMRERGVRRARAGNLLAEKSGPWDTVLSMMNGIGLAGTLEGLGRLLDGVARLLEPGGQLLCDSWDPRRSRDLRERARVTTRRAEGRHPGEARIRLEYDGRRSAPFSWLYLDAATLVRCAALHGWHAQVVFEEADGSFLARLVRR